MLLTCRPWADTGGHVIDMFGHVRNLCTKQEHLMRKSDRDKMTTETERCPASWRRDELPEMESCVPSDWTPLGQTLSHF